jgi:hypothetical protein
MTCALTTAILFGLSDRFKDIGQQIQRQRAKDAFGEKIPCDRVVRELAAENIVPEQEAVEADKENNYRANADEIFKVLHGASGKVFL